MSSWSERHQAHRLDDVQHHHRSGGAPQQRAIAFRVESVPLCGSHLRRVVPILEEKTGAEQAPGRGCSARCATRSAPPWAWAARSAGGAFRPARTGLRRRAGWPRCRGCACWPAGCVDSHCGGAPLLAAPIFCHSDTPAARVVAGAGRQVEADLVRLPIRLRGRTSASAGWPRRRPRCGRANPGRTRPNPAPPRPACAADLPMRARACSRSAWAISWPITIATSSSLSFSWSRMP